MGLKFFPPVLNNKLKGFTLAETLITIMVIGVIAAIMIPALSYLIQTRVREHQVDVAKQKFNRAVEMMTLNGKMGPYYSNTLDFVSELQNHFKITKVCRVGDSPSALPPITDCFGDNYETITINSDGDTVNLSDIKTAADFGIDKADDENDWTSDNIGILTIDGTRMILTYNSKCAAVDAGLYKGDTSYACIAGVADVDGDKKPNTLYKDVYLFGSAKKLGVDCIGNEVGICVNNPVKVSDIISSKGFVTRSQCLSASYGSDDFCGVNATGAWASHVDYNFYARVIEECDGLDKIISQDDTQKIVDYIMDDSLTNDEKDARAQALGLHALYADNKNAWLMTSNVDGYYFLYFTFGPTQNRSVSTAVFNQDINFAGGTNMYVYCYAK